MSVFKVPKNHSSGNRWIVQLTVNGKRERLYSDPETGKAIESKSRARELEVYLLKKMSEPKKKGNPEKHSVRASRDLFYSYLQKKLKPTSLYARIHYFDNEISRFFGNTAIEDLTNADIERFNDAANARMTPGQLNNTISAARSFLKFARKWNPVLIPENVFKFKTAVPDDHVYHFYTVEQERKFLSVIEDKNDKLLFTLFCYYGFRITECLALQRRDVDLKARTISIRKIVQTKTEKGGQVLLTPKTKRSVRTLALVPGVAELIPPNMQPDDFLFPTRQAGPSKVMGEITVRRLAGFYAKKAGLPVIKVHEFRHSCASNLLRKNVPLRVVANWLGDTEGTILNYYSHMFGDEAEVVPSVIAESFGECSDGADSQNTIEA